MGGLHLAQSMKPWMRDLVVFAFATAGVAGFGYMILDMRNDKRERKAAFDGLEGKIADARRRVLYVHSADWMKVHAGEREADPARGFLHPGMALCPTCWPEYEGWGVEV